MWSVPTLYKLAIHVLMESDFLNPSCLECIPGFVKEDILNIALQKGKKLIQLRCLLHCDMKVLQTRESNISSEDLISISKCCQMRVLEMNPPVSTRFNHPSNLLNAMLSQLNCLVKLHLQRNDGVTDEVVHTLVLHASNLQELDVSGCRKLTDCAAESLAALQKLQALNLSLTQVGDEGLICLAMGRSALRLTELCMNGCTNITGESFKNIIECCKNLQILSFNGCTNLYGQMVLEHLNRKTSMPFSRMCCNITFDSGPCQHLGNTILKLRNTGLLIIH